jgi:hypothetical protein
MLAWTAGGRESNAVPTARAGIKLLQELGFSDSKQLARQLLKLAR